MVETKYRQPEPDPLPDINCPSTDCHFAKNTITCVSCNNFARTTEPVGSLDPNGRCSLEDFIDTWCDELGVACPEYRLGACASPTPGFAYKLQVGSDFMGKRQTLWAR